MEETNIGSHDRSHLDKASWTLAETSVREDVRRDPDFPSEDDGFFGGRDQPIKFAHARLFRNLFPRNPTGNRSVGAFFQKKEESRRI